MRTASSTGVAAHGASFAPARHAHTLCGPRQGVTCVDHLSQLSRELLLCSLYCMLVAAGSAQAQGERQGTLESPRCMATQCSCMQDHGAVPSQAGRYASCLWQGDCLTKAFSWEQLLLLRKLGLQAGLPPMAAEYVPEPQLGSMRRQAFLMPSNTSFSGNWLLSTWKGECSQLSACGSIQGYLILVCSSCLQQCISDGPSAGHSRPRAWHAKSVVGLSAR